MKKTTLFCLLLLSSILTGCTKQTVNSQYSITDVATLESVVEQIAAETSSYKLVTKITETPFSDEDTKIRHFDQNGNVYIFDSNTDMHYYYVDGTLKQFVNTTDLANSVESFLLYVGDGAISSTMTSDIANPQNKEIVKYQFLIYLMDFLPTEIKEEGDLSFNNGVWSFSIRDFQVEAEDIQSFTLTIDEATKEMKVVLQVTDTAKITCTFTPKPEDITLPENVVY